MMSKKHEEDLIFNYDRPATPTAICGTFSLAQQQEHGTLVASDSLDNTNQDSNDGSPLPIPGTANNGRIDSAMKGSLLTQRPPLLHSNSFDDVSVENNNNRAGPNKTNGDSADARLQRNMSHPDGHTGVEVKESEQTFLRPDLEESTSHKKLRLAEDQIRELEMRLEILERELRSSQERAKKLASQGKRVRRLARSGDLFRRNQTTNENDIDVADKNEALGKFFSLTVSEIYPSTEAKSDSEEGSRPLVPLYLRRFEGQVFAVGPRGVTIGSSPFCGICIPEEAEIKEYHACVQLNKSTNQFEVISGSSDGSLLFTYHDARQSALSISDSCTSVTHLTLRNQLKFRTGMVEWIVAPIPQRKLIITRMFDALRQGDLSKLEELWQEAKSWNEYLHKLPISKGVKSPIYIDSSTEEDPDYTLVDDEMKHWPKLSDSLSDHSGVQDRQLNGGGDRPEKMSLLHVAVDCLFFYGVEFLLKKDAQVNKQCGTAKQSALHIAVRRNNLQITQHLLFYGADLELTDARHLTAVALAGTYSLRKLLLSSLMLCAAADGGDFEEVKRLIESGSSPNAKALCHKAPLHLAALNGHVKVVEFLLKNKAFINMAGGRRNRTALHYASLTNNVEVVKVLMKFNADQQIVDSMGYTALNLSNGGEICRMLHQNPLSLCLASQAGDMDEVRSILESQSLSRKASSNEACIQRVSRTASGREISKNVSLSNFGLCLAVDQRNVQGHAPLHLASAAGNLELVQLLVSYGASVDLPGGLDKWTALFYAALAGHSEVVGFLLAIGADPHLTDAQGLIVVEHMEQNIDDLKDKLNRKSFQATSFDQDGSSQESHTLLAPAQLHRQCSDSSLDNKGQRSWMKKQVGRLEHVLSVLQSGQQKLLNALEQKDMKLLRHALEYEDVKLDEPLSKHTQTTALCFAAISGMPEFVSVLLEYNADPRITDGQSLTPIHVAAKAGHEDVVQKLLEHGVDMNIRTNLTRQSPLHIAAYNSHENVVKLLVLAGADREAEDMEGLTPFDMVEDIDIKELLATGINLLYIAIARGDMDKVTMYINECKISVDVTFTTGLSPLQVACLHQKFGIVEFLISQRADVNFQGGQNASSPLHLAVHRNAMQIAQALVEHGAKLSAKDAEGKTPFEVAKSNSMRKVLVDARPYKKSEMLALEEQVADSGSDEDVSRKDLCRICFDSPVNTIVLPCGHQAFCKDCASQLEICAFDRRPIAQVVPVFRVAGD